jgi:hypothetical protein
MAKSRPRGGGDSRRRLGFEVLEERRLLAADFGDAPDLGLGIGLGDYRTLASDDGPRHTIVAGLHLGATVDGYDGGVLQNATANADDVNGALPDDEDGVANPQVDLVLTVGATPRMNLWTTNTTGTEATLYGWIDYNGNGEFENATERASIVIPSSSEASLVTLTFPTVPEGFHGKSYARFRLSTDDAAANSTGAATDGEVEDYEVLLLEPSGATYDPLKSKILGNGPWGGPDINASLNPISIAPVGDLDQDGITDLVIGTPENSTGGPGRGAVFILFMNNDGSVRDYEKIAHGTANAPSLANDNNFGISVTALGDLDGDGVIEIAVGANNDGDNRSGRGAVYVLFMNTDGSVKASRMIGNLIGGGPSLGTGDHFGSSVASLGDFDGDGVGDIIVGADGAYHDGLDRGAAYVFMMNADGTAKSTQKITSGLGGGPVLTQYATFGHSIATVGDLNRDGVVDVVVGTRGDSRSDAGRMGELYVLLMNPDGTVGSSQRISGGVGGGPDLSDGAHFGYSVASVGDFDGDGVRDVAVAATGEGVVYVLMMNEDGTAREYQKLSLDAAETTHRRGLGSSVAMLGDLDGDGLRELATGSATFTLRTGLILRGVDVFSLQRPNHFDPQFLSPQTISVPENTTFVTNLLASDEDVPTQPLTFSIVGSSDQQWFTLTAEGKLSFKNPRDFEVPIDTDLNNEYLVEVEVSDGHRKSSSQVFHISVTDVDDAPSVDFGDAPDTAIGTDPGNYSTVADDDGPQHGIVAGLYLGARVDGDSGALQNGPANSDDVDGALPDDEDGVANPAADLFLTIGAAPAVNLWATNTTGKDATLYGWIDYDGDGEFENATERASITVPSAPAVSLVTLTFPKVPTGSQGKTYARFRFSTDAAAANSTGTAMDGEVEDYQVAIVAPVTGEIDNSKSVRISNDLNGGPTLDYGDRLGRSVASIGDLDGDGVVDLAVGADGLESDSTGSVYILFMNRDGTVKSSQEIPSGNGSGSEIADGAFGSAVASLGDLDGDGNTDIAVGDNAYSRDQTYSGAVYVLFLNADGTVKRKQRLTSEFAGVPYIRSFSQFGHSLSAIGDLDGDGITELAVGAPGYVTEQDDPQISDDQTGGVVVLFLNSDGTVKHSQTIAQVLGGGPLLEEDAYFGMSVTSLGDIDGDGVSDLAVGAGGRDGEYSNHGAAYVLLMNTDGTAKTSRRIVAPPLSTYDQFGCAIGSVGDLDGDGVTDIVVAACDDDTGGHNRGAIYVLMLNTDGTVKNTWKIADGKNGGPSLDDGGRFGRDIAALGDLDGDGYGEFVVGQAERDYGVLHVFSWKTVAPDYGDAPDAAPGSGPGNYQTRSEDNGPSHVIVASLHLGGGVDGDDGTLENYLAEADSMTGVTPGDEDGLVNKFADLQWTVGSEPRINLWTTNTTGTNATLYGWIDYNGDGVFDNATERRSAAVPDGTDSQIVSLTFPLVPNGAVGETYARFRLSTDSAAADPVGPAADGEVEDYRIEITVPSRGVVESAKTIKIVGGSHGLPELPSGEDFGDSVVSLGDLDGDGVVDLAVGNGEAVFILFMNSDGTVKTINRIDEDSAAGPTGWRADRYGTFGEIMATLGDLDGDGATEIIVEGWGGYRLLYLNTDGSLKESVFVELPGIIRSFAGLGDLDGNGIGDIAVGFETEGQLGEYNSGAVYVLLLNSDGSVKAGQIIADEIGGGPTLNEYDHFGSSIASLGDIDGDGISDIAVGATGDNGGAGAEAEGWFGAVYVLNLNWDGTVKSYGKIARSEGGGPALAEEDGFGSSLVSLGDLDGDGISDIAVGTYSESAGDNGRGTVYLLNLNADGTAKAYREIANETGGGPTLTNWDQFGSSIAALGDLDGDGIKDLAIAAHGDDSGGAVYVLFLQAVQLEGDYNLDGSVDAADYSVWRDALGATGLLPYSGADGDGDGMVDQDDYAVWKANFGRTLEAGSAGQGGGSGKPGIEKLIESNFLLQGEVEELTAGQASSGTRRRTNSTEVDEIDDLLKPRRRGLGMASGDGSGGRTRWRPPAEPGAGGRVRVAASHDLALLAWRTGLGRRGDQRGPSVREWELGRGEHAEEMSFENVDTAIELLADGVPALSTR